MMPARTYKDDLPARLVFAVVGAIIGAAFVGFFFVSPLDDLVGLLQSRIDELTSGMMFIETANPYAIKRIAINGVVYDLKWNDSANGWIAPAAPSWTQDDAPLFPVPDSEITR